MDLTRPAFTWLSLWSMKHFAPLVRVAICDIALSEYFLLFVLMLLLRFRTSDADGLKIPVTAGSPIVQQSAFRSERAPRGLRNGTICSICFHWEGVP